MQRVTCNLRWGFDGGIEIPSEGKGNNQWSAKKKLIVLICVQCAAAFILLPLL